MNRFDPEKTVSVIRGRWPRQPFLGIVLGSGFGDTAEAVATEATLPYDELPGLVVPRVAGHRGRLLLGALGGMPVAVFDGRSHYYEGHSLETVTFPVRVLAALGAGAVVLTNAAGGIRPDLQPGDLVALTDHLNFTGANPLRGHAAGHGFVDLSETYDPGLRKRLQDAGRELGLDVKEGVYAGVSGPSFETPAEIRALASLGADLVGMSTVAEAIVARHARLDVLAISCVTNRAAGLGGRITHDEVLAIGRRTAPAVSRLLSRFAASHAGDRSP